MTRAGNRYEASLHFRCPKRVAEQLSLFEWHSFVSVTMQQEDRGIVRGRVVDR